MVMKKCGGAGIYSERQRVTVFTVLRRCRWVGRRMTVV